ncbi:MAG: DUF6516 family protein [Bacteroidales bacterium]|nr:DUF6516 family protein [Bacteroidales bacterium]
MKCLWKTNRNYLRYNDNAEHYPKLNTFPHHKHLPNNVIKSTEPKLFDILMEIYKLKYRDKK